MKDLNIYQEVLSFFLFNSRTQTANMTEKKHSQDKTPEKKKLSTTIRRSAAHRLNLTGEFNIQAALSLIKPINNFLGINPDKNFPGSQKLFEARD